MAMFPPHDQDLRSLNLMVVSRGILVVVSSKTGGLWFSYALWWFIQKLNHFIIAICNKAVCQCFCEKRDILIISCKVGIKCHFFQACDQ